MADTAEKETTEEAPKSWEEQIKEKYGISTLEELHPLVEKEQVVKEVFVPQESEFSLMEKYMKETDFTASEVRKMFQQDEAWEVVEKAYTPCENLAILAKEDVKGFWLRYAINEEKLSISKAIEKAELKEIEAEEDSPEVQRNLRAAINKLSKTEGEMFDRFKPKEIEKTKEESKEPIKYSEEDKNEYLTLLQENNLITDALKENGIDFKLNSPETIERAKNILALAEQNGASLFGDGVDENGEPIKVPLMLSFILGDALMLNINQIIQKAKELGGAEATTPVKDSLGQGVKPKGREANGVKQPTPEEAEEIQRQENLKNAELAKQQSY